MIAPDQPVNEPERLAALRNLEILDTLPEEDYDSITRLAAFICQTPTALISLVDADRQWFKSRYNFGVDETPRDIAFCAHNILSPSEPLIVEDARVDQRFVANPLVTADPNIVFYAGVPIVDPDGHALGSLCVLDQKPRSLSAEQRQALQDLTRQVVNLLQLRRNNNALQEQVAAQTAGRQDADDALARMVHMFDQSPVGISTMSRDKLTYTSANTFYGELVGRAPETLIGKPLLEAIPEIAGQGFEDLLNGVLDTGVPFLANEVPFDVLREDVLETLYVNLAYQPVRNADGTTDAVLVVATDVTAQVQTRKIVEVSEARFRALVEQSPIATSVFTDSRRHIVERANSRMLAIWGKDESVIGKPFLEALPELAGQPFQALLDEVFDTGTPHVGTGTEAHIEIDGELRTFYFNFTFQPVFDADGRVTSVINIAVDVTDTIRTRQILEESERRFRSLVEQALTPVCVFRGENLVLDIANQAVLNVWQTDRSAIGKPLLEILPELRDQPIIPWLLEVYREGTTLSLSEVAVRLNRKDGTIYNSFFDFVYQPYRDTDGTITGVMAMANDVTAQVAARQVIEKSETRFRSLIMDAPMSTALFTGRELTIAVANEPMLRSWGKTEAVIGKTLREAMPELEGQPFFDILDNVYTTGETFSHAAAPAYIREGGQLVTKYFNYTLKALRNEDGAIYGIINTNVNVTEQILAQQKLADSETKLRGIVETAPAAIGLLIGRDLVIESPNQTFIDIVGKGWDVAGKPLREAMPELVTEGQPFLKILDDVYTTGVPFHSPGSLVKIVQNGVMTHRYYNITYTPVRNAAGEIYAILNVAIDVTDQIQAQQAAEESELKLRDAVEMAGLGTWTIDLLQNAAFYEDRVADWFGLSSGAPLADLFSVVPPADAVRMQEAIGAACAPGTDGSIDIEHEVVNARTGRRRIIHSKGQVMRGADGTPTTIVGTGQDITIQKDLQLALEIEVQTRTEELAGTNEELQSVNEELTDSNTKLIHSNEELAQYAYVASHDLQEPLRKIQIFSGLLSKKEELSEASRELVEKMSGSAERMTALIQDLLTFSRLLSSEALYRSVNLEETVKAVCNDFELVVSEKGATINIGPLPVLEAIGLQMNQLFHNLIGNALKFTRPGVAPAIDVTAEKIEGELLTRHVPKPLPFATYYRICVQDNGIGFEPEHVERIFEVFKRLHSREAFPGSGIGLALCRRIAVNHHGAIYTESTPGQGATFCIILPSRQHE